MPAADPHAIVILEPSGKRVEVPPGATLLWAIRQAGLPLGSSCAGEGVCGRCRVQVLAGEGALEPAGSGELELLERIDGEPGERVACLARVTAGQVTATTTYWGGPPRGKAGGP